MDSTNQGVEVVPLAALMAQTGGNALSVTLRPCRCVVVSLAGVEQLGTAELALLLRLYSHVVRCGKTCLVSEVSVAARQTLKKLGLQGVLREFSPAPQESRVAAPKPAAVTVARRVESPAGAAVTQARYGE